jgi:hypothetical protein
MEVIPTSSDMVALGFPPLDGRSICAKELAAIKIIAISSRSFFIFFF